MASTFEVEIHALLKGSVDVESVAQELAHRWELNLLSNDERRDFAHFLFATKQFQTLFDLCKKSLANSAILPWAPLTAAISKTGIHLAPSDIEKLIDGASAEDQVIELIKVRELEQAGAQFSEIRKTLREQSTAMLEARKRELKDKLQFLRANLLAGEEERVLEELQALFPRAAEVQREREAFDIRRARDVISRSRESRFQDPRQDDMPPRLTQEEDVIRKLVVTRAQELLKEDRTLALDLAMNLHFMEFNEDAAKLISPELGKPQVDWFYLELLIESRQFLVALEAASIFEIRYSADPDSSFAATYARARALRGLGQDGDAIELLRELVNVRPFYKSAHSLLTEWSGGKE